MVSLMVGYWAQRDQSTVWFLVYIDWVLVMVLWNRFKENTYLSK